MGHEVNFFGRESAQNTDIGVNLSDDQVEQLDDIADERGIARSELLRQWLYAGWKLDSTIELTVESAESQVSMESDPYRAIFAEALPETEEDAVELTELKSQILDETEKEVNRLYREFDELSLSDGDMYLDDE